MTFMVESDQKHNLVQKHIQTSVSFTTSPTPSHITGLNTPVISFPPEYTISDPYKENPEYLHLPFSLH